MDVPTRCLCCQLMTHSHQPLRDRRVPQGPQAITQQEETTILPAKGQNVPQKAKGGIRESWRGDWRGVNVPCLSQLVTATGMILALQLRNFVCDKRPCAGPP